MFRSAREGMKPTTWVLLLTAYSCFEGPIRATADNVDALYAAAHSGSRALLKGNSVYVRDLQINKDAETEFWGSAGFGGALRRSLKQQYGSSIGRIKLTNTTGSSSLKTQPSGDNCQIDSSSTAALDCSSNLNYSVPACCGSSSQTASTICQSWDDYRGITCSAASRPYPACCKFRDQPEIACDVYVDRQVQCTTAKPKIGCCVGGTCSIRSYYDPSSTTISCPTTTKYGCCPA